jgi:hypothetical protein
VNEEENEDEWNLSPNHFICVGYTFSYHKVEIEVPVTMWVSLIELISPSFHQQPVRGG